MGGSRERERSNGRKDNKKKRRKSRSRSDSRSYDDHQQSSSVPQNNNNAQSGSNRNTNKKMKGDGNNNGNRNYGNQANNYDDLNQGNNAGANNMGAMHFGNPRGNPQNGMMNNFMNQRMVPQNPALMQQMMGGNMALQFMRQQGANNQMNMMMGYGMGAVGQMAQMGQMGQMNTFKMPNAPFSMVNRLGPQMRPFSFVGGNNLGVGAGMMGQNPNLIGGAEGDDNGKKQGKGMERLNGTSGLIGTQSSKNKVDTEPFVVFKNMQLITGIVEVIQNTFISVEKGDPQLVFYVCKKAIQEILKRMKEMGIKKLADQTQNLLQELEAQFQDEQKTAEKENECRGRLRKEKHLLFDNDNFNQGVENIDHMILKLIHSSDKISDIFHLIQTDEANRVDLSSYQQTYQEKITSQSIKSLSDPSNRLFQESLKLFNMPVQ